jgi:hypothetical protein
MRTVGDMRGRLAGTLLRGTIAVATSALMLGTFVGLSAAAPGGEHGKPAQSQKQNGQPASNQSRGNSVNAPGQVAKSQAATSGDALDPEELSTRPGWGCGDTNHLHSGPPGDPDAVSPCTEEVITITTTAVSGTETITETITTTGTVTSTSTETVTTTTATI